MAFPANARNNHRGGKSGLIRDAPSNERLGALMRNERGDEVNRFREREGTDCEQKEAHASAYTLQMECLELFFELRREAQIRKIPPQLAGIG
jgi:hypothetical protein